MRSSKFKVQGSKLAEKLLDLAKKKSRQCEVIFSLGQSRSIQFENNRLKKLAENFSTRIGLRLIYKGKIGVAVTNKMENWRGLVEKAVAVSKYGPKAYFKFPQKATLKQPKVFSKNLTQQTNRKFIQFGVETIDKLRKFNSKVLWDISFGLRESEWVHLNSMGLAIGEKESDIGFFLGGDLVKEDNMLQIWEGQSSRKNDIGYEFYIHRLKEKFRKAKKIAKIKTGFYPVVFTPHTFGEVLEYVIQALSGKTVLEGSSRLMDKLEKKVFDERLTVIDNGLLDWKTGSGRFDDEGVAVKPLKLIEKGLVKNFYYDLQTAARAKTESTGHGSRGMANASASPSLHNVLIKEGAKDYVTILEGIKEGVVVEGVLGAGQDNPFNGDFSMSLSLGYKIENGKIVGRIKDTMIAGNIFELLARGFVALSKEREWVGGSFLSPWVVLEPVRVVSRA